MSGGAGAAGYRVIRFWTDEVRDNVDGVVETIPAALAEPPPTPNPSPPLAARAGGGEAIDGAVRC